MQRWYCLLEEDKGLTLIETIVAMTMLLILVAAFTGAFVVGLQGEVNVDQHQAAGSLAENIVEQLREEDLADLVGNNVLSDLLENQLDDFDISDLSSSAREFYTNQNISESNSFVNIDSDNGNLYDVKVYIEWEDGKNFSLETRIHSD